MSDLIDKAEAVTLLHEIADDFADPHVRGAAIAVAHIFTERAAAPHARGVGVDIEDMARTIYDAMRFDRKDKTPEWVNGGNSHAQVEARAAAARIVAALAPTDAAQAREAALEKEVLRLKARLWAIGHAAGIETKEDLMKDACDAIGEART